MKNTFILLLAVTTAALAVVCVVQSHKSSTQQIQTAALRGELEAKSQEMESLQAAHQGAERQRSRLAAEAETLAAQLAAHQRATTNVTAPAPAAAPALASPPPLAGKEKPDEAAGGLGKMVAKMMANPEGRQFMRDQQRMMIDQSYGALIKQMGLTPEETAKFKDLLTDNNMKAAESGLAMLSSATATNGSAAFKGMADQQASFDEQVKAFLGDDRYAQYKGYQETLPDRMILNQFKLQAGSDYNLSDVQSEALLGFMKEERKSVAASSKLPLTTDSNKDPAALQALMSGDKVDEIIQAQETVNQRVYERARTILSSEQLETLSRFQTNSIRTTRMGMTMMKTMFGNQKAGAGGTPSQ